MKLFHLADLHIGKRLHEVSLLDVQSDLLGQILSAVESERPDGILIAGDVYDKSVPPIEALELFGGFLSALAARACPVYIVAGNHDSPTRLSYLSDLTRARGICTVGAYGGECEPITLSDEHGPLDLWLMPFLRPHDVRRAHPDAEVSSYSEAFSYAIERLPIDPSRRNILVAHQFFAGGVAADSEELSVGGSEAVDPACLAPFDYVALGHLHRPQRVGRETVRYAGSPFAYSFSEATDVKSLTVVELGEKGSISVRALPLTPSRPLVELRGSYRELMHLGNQTDTKERYAYLYITLTDEDDVPDAVYRLRTLYPYLLRLDYDNTRSRADALPEDAPSVDEATPFELFAELYEKQNGRELTEEQTSYLQSLIDRIWEGEEG